MKWSDEQVATLKRLWNENIMSSAQIAHVLGPDFTKNMICGAVYRMRLPSHNAFKERNRLMVQPKKPKPPRKPKQVTRRPIYHDPMKSPPSFRLAPEPIPEGAIWLPLPGTVPVSMDRLERHQCKWPMGERDFTFCGCAAEPGTVYCATHHARAYRAAA